MSNGAGTAGWQPDPTGRHELRYWDGLAWSDHVADGGVTTSDPIAVGTPPGATSNATKNRRPLLLGIGAVAALAIIAGVAWLLLRGGEERDPVAEQARAEAAVLAPTDLPEGFTADTTSDDAEFDFSAAGCEALGAARAAVIDEPEAESPRLEQGQELSISNIVGISDDERINAYLAAFVAPEAIECLERELMGAGDDLPPGLSFGAVEVVRGSVAPIGEASSAIDASVPLLSDEGGQLATLRTRIVIVRVDQALTITQFTSLDESVDPELERTVIGAVVGRLEASAP